MDRLMEKVQARVNRRLRQEFAIRCRAYQVAFPVSMPLQLTWWQRVKGWFHA